MSDSAQASGTRDATPIPEATAAWASAQWTGKTRGGYWGHWFFIQLVRWGGVRLAYAWLAVITVYFVVASPQAYRASCDYWRRVKGPQSWWRWPLLVYRHFFEFGVTLLDRLGVIMGQARMDFTYENEELLHGYLARGQGIILLGAHVGSWEIGGHLLARHGRPVNLVVLEREEVQIRNMYGAALKDKRFHILTASEDPFRSIPILAALRRGEIVALHGDRPFGGRNLPVAFFGAEARFPLGAYELAAVTGAPLFHVFAVRERWGCYRFMAGSAQHLKRGLGRREPQTWLPWVQQYVRHLETVVRQYPYQWANFYSFWENPVSGVATPHS